MITLSIDVTKLDKSKFITGKIGTYCNLVLLETPNSEYGDYMVKQDTSKEDREAGVRMPILGNAKVRRPRDQRGEPLSSHASPPPAARPSRPDDDEIPF